MCVHVGAVCMCGQKCDCVGVSVHVPVHVQGGMLGAGALYVCVCVCTGGA